jgi:hypothetical protein
MELESRHGESVLPFQVDGDILGRLKVHDVGAGDGNQIVLMSVYYLGDLGTILISI